MSKQIQVIDGGPFTVELPYWSNKKDTYMLVKDGLEYPVVWNELEEKFVVIPF